jgi:Putative serine esterase (DUF676)
VKPVDGVVGKDPVDLNWVTQFLPEDLKPDVRDCARLFLYGYNSRWMDNAPVVDVHSLGRRLSVTIETNRQKEGTRDRRIIFVVHSHGGLVVKAALVDDANHGNKALVFPNTDGIVFFGTPHRGSALVGLAQILARFLSFRGSERGLLDSLMPQSMENWNLHDSFSEILQSRPNDSIKGNVELWNFYEERKTTVFDFGFWFKKERLVCNNIIRGSLVLTESRL